MQQFSLGRRKKKVIWRPGSKKMVSQFTVAKGLWILALLALAGAILFSLFLLGYLRVD